VQPSKQPICIKPDFVDPVFKCVLSLAFVVAEIGLTVSPSDLCTNLRREQHVTTHQKAAATAVENARESNGCALITCAPTVLFLTFPTNSTDLINGRRSTLLLHQHLRTHLSGLGTRSQPLQGMINLWGCSLVSRLTRPPTRTTPHSSSYVYALAVS
jgi:hypothetical protein